jgi:hypothetical protein
MMNFSLKPTATLIILMHTAWVSFSQLRPVDKKDFYTYPTKIGLVLVVNPIAYMKESDIPVTLLSQVRVKKRQSVSKYDGALKTIEPLTNPTDTLRKFYVDLYEERHKQVIVINESIDSGVVKFKGPKESGRYYFINDLRPLQNKFKVDQLLIVSVDYGLVTGGPLGMEMNRMCFSVINSNLVNLRDNSLIVKTKSDDIELIYEWNTPPGYEELKLGIKHALSNAIKAESKKYKW